MISHVEQPPFFFIARKLCIFNPTVSIALPFFVFTFANVVAEPPSNEFATSNLRQML